MDNKVDQIDLMGYIARLSRAARRRPRLGQHISPGEHRVIDALLRDDGLRATDLAEMADLRPASLTGVIKNIEEKGLIRRQPDPKDSRVTRIFATELAKKEQKLWEKERREENARLNNCLSDRERKLFCQICGRLTDFFVKEYGQEEREEPGMDRDHHHDRGPYGLCGEGGASQ